MKPKIIGSQNHIHQYDLREFNGRIFFVTDLHGHSPTKSGDVEKLGNQIYCDLGSFFRDKIAMIEINDEFINWVKND